jgi:hypothetical protein
MDAIAKVTEEDTQAAAGFLSAVKTLADVNKDPEFYELARKVIGEP